MPATVAPIALGLLLAGPQDPPPREIAMVLEVAADRGPGPVDVTVSGVGELREPCFGRLGDDVLVRVDPAPGDAVRLRWVARSDLGAGEHRLALRLTTGGPDAARVFAFEDDDLGRTLRIGTRTVYRYETLFDPEHFDATYKPFHQLGALHDDGFVTKGAGGRFSHHRGVFVGWNRTREEDGRSHDFWHCRDGRHQRHTEHVASGGGPVVADASERVEWRDADGRAVVVQATTVTAWDVGARASLLDFRVELRAAGEAPVELRGDPQHAGFQVRVADEVHDRASETVFERPQTARGGRNDVWRDCDWARLRFHVRGHGHALQHMAHPDNPGPFVYSTRPYGRFGSFQAIRLEPGVPVVLRHRLLLLDDAVANGSDPVAAYAAFAAPVTCRPDHDR